MGNFRRPAPAPPASGCSSAALGPALPDRLAYLRDTCELLWPSPAEVTMSGRPASAEGSEFVLLRWPSQSRLLVPAVPQAAAAAVRHYGVPGSRSARLGARFLALALATRVTAPMLRGGVCVVAPPGAETIETYLAQAFHRDLRVSMYLGFPRANRKPVLQLLNPAGGEPLGFAKIGVNDLTRDLVDAEHRSLALLNQARLAGVTVPRVLHYGQWRGLSILVLSALPMWAHRRPLRRGQLSAAAAEVAGVGGLRSGPLAGEGYLEKLRTRLAKADEGPERSALDWALEVLAERVGGKVLTYGAWHGDFTPWNMASTSSGLLVWDWERFSNGVPLGFDVLHYWLQSQVGRSGRDPGASAIDCADRASCLLAPFGTDPGGARLTAVLYLVELAVRYLVDRQAEAGAPRGAPKAWLIPAIAHEVTRMTAAGRAV